MVPNTAAFIGVAVAVVVVPGPDMALILRNTLIGGRRIGVATVSGVIAGILGRLLSRPGPRRLMQRATGAILVGLGARLAFERS